MALNSAVVGLGMDGLVLGAAGTAEDFAWSAVRSAAQDAGLSLSAIDGLIVSRSSLASDVDLGLDLHAALGLQELRFLQISLCEGAGAIVSLQMAAMLVSSGEARAVACVFADSPIQDGQRASESFQDVKPVAGLKGLRYGAGLMGAPAMYALACRRYMVAYGLVEEDLANVAMTTREWAVLNPDAVYRNPLDRESYFAARYIAEPLRLFDCARPVNGAIAVIVASIARAADLRQPKVRILGFGQGHHKPANLTFGPDEISRAGRISAERAFSSSGLGPGDVDAFECYDAFSFLTLVSLEQYGFCKPGEAAQLVKMGATRPGGRLPVNTGGGQLSGYYLQGMTPVAEAILQARHQAGERQVPDLRCVAVANNGGIFNHHATMLLAADA